MGSSGCYRGAYRGYRASIWGSVGFTGSPLGAIGGNMGDIGPRFGVLWGLLGPPWVL